MKCHLCKWHAVRMNHLNAFQTFRNTEKYFSSQLEVPINAVTEEWPFSCSSTGPLSTN